MKHDETKKFIICPSCKILGSVSVLQSDDELTDKVKHFLMGGSSCSSGSAQHDSGYDMLEDGEPPTEYHRRFAELNEKFIKKEWINAPVAYLDDLFAVLKNICSVYLIHAKECLMSLNALYSLPINDSPLSSFLTFSESLDRNPAALSQLPIITTPLNEITENSKKNLVEIIARLLDTVEMGLKILDHLYQKGPGMNRYFCDSFLSVLHDNLRSIGRDQPSCVMTDQLYLRHRTAKPLEILDPVTNQPIDLQSFKRNEVLAKDNKPKEHLSRTTRSAPTTPNFGNSAGQTEGVLRTHSIENGGRTILEIRDPRTNEPVKLPENTTKTEAPEPTPMTIIDPKTNKPINFPGNIDHILFCSEECPSENMNISGELDKPSSATTMTIIDPWTKEPIKLPMTNTEISE
ncbi:unnamed protein product [Hymenolepis diminuta]|uniref:Uncharacterized protein n=1 Tax=Hymenolepis diminuta TaxID=6216 RepID=A0A564YED4_HYMDI|nr:unnamed protein product [Hymenolepis diminuta]